MSKDYNVSARLTAGDSSVPISKFSLEFPEGVLGSKLSAEVADLSLELTGDEDVLFEVGVGHAGEMEWSAMMDLGRIDSLDSTIKWLDDSKIVSAVSGLADRWNYAPEAPIFLYDPDVIDPLSSGESALGELVDENHNPIFPELVPKRSFDLQQLLSFVYVNKLGFSRVITNVPNFPLNFVQIPLTSSFHQAALSEVSIFQPEFYNDDQGTLFIVDPQGTLPSGLEARQIRLKNYASFQRTKQTGKAINAVVLSYSANFGSGPITSRVEQETQEVGVPFSDGWQRTTVSRFINDFHDNPANLDEVTRSVVTRVLTQVTAEYDGLARLVSTEDQVDHFLYDFRLKTGYTKTLTKFFPVFLDESAASHLVQIEENQIVWESLTVPGEFVKRFEITKVTGSVVKTFDNPSDPDTSTFRLQSYDQVSKLNRNDLPSADDSVSAENHPIYTKIDGFRNTGRDQIEVSSQRVNYLADSGRSVTDRGDTFQHTGTIQARAITSRSLKINMVLSSGGDSARRVPATLDAGNVPFGVAKSLAERILARQGAQPTKVSMELSGLDMALRRGSIRSVPDREGNLYLVFITGLSISGDNLGQPSFAVRMNARGIVIG